MSNPAKSEGLNPTETWRLLVDMLDEAEASEGKTGRRRRRVGRPHRRVVDLELGAMKLAQQVKVRLDKQLKNSGFDWIPDEGFIKSLDSVVSAIDRLGRSIRATRKAERDAMGGLTADQLHEVHIAELKRCAADLTDEDVAIILATWHTEELAEAVVKTVATQRDALIAMRVACLRGEKPVNGEAKP